MKRAKWLAIAAVSMISGSVCLNAQFGGVVSDPVQEGHSAQQLLNDIRKLAKLDAQIQTLAAAYAQLQANARYFSLKNAFAGWGNQIVRNWWSPNTYGMTALWSPMVLFGAGSPTTAWTNVSVAVRANPQIVAAGRAALAGGAAGAYVPYSGMAANAATVETFDGAGPTAVQTLGNARAHLVQMNAAISQLQSFVLDGTPGANSEVQQLNLIAAGAVQQLEMAQTTNNVLTSLLEQQTIANKIHRDQLADHLNFTSVWQGYAGSQPVAWGNAATSISGYRIP